MSSWDLIRWCGLAAIVGGVAYVVQGIVSLFVRQEVPFTSFSDYLIEILYILGLAGTLAGIGGLHYLLRERYGQFGAASSVVAFVGFGLLFVASVSVALTGRDVLPGFFVVGFLTALVGAALLGTAILRRLVLSFWHGVLFIVGNLVGLAAIQIGGAILLGVIWGMVGYVLVSNRGTADQQPARVS